MVPIGFRAKFKVWGHHRTAAFGKPLLMIQGAARVNVIPESGSLCKDRLRKGLPNKGRGLFFLTQ